MISKTRTISIAAPPDRVLDVVADPYQLPSWAPAFARSVRPDGADWIVEGARGAGAITVRVDRAHGTVDLLAADDARRGAFSRVLPNGDGSEYVFTLFFPAGADVAAQMAIVEDELRSVRRLCERDDQPTIARSAAT